MPSKLAINAMKDGRTVRSAGTENRDALATELKEKFNLPPDAVKQIVDALVSNLEQKETLFVATDTALERELGDDDPIRKARDENARLISSTLVSLRPTLTAAHGEEAVRELGMDGPTPGDPQALALLGERLITNLGDWKERPSLIEDVYFMPRKWAAKLGQPVARLRAALDALSIEDRQAQQLRSDRDRDFARFDEAHDATADILSALLDAAGRSDLAGKVRRTRRKDLKKDELDAAPEPAVGL